LYLASNTAFKIGKLKEAGFLFYAAQIRKSFDQKRYALSGANGKNIQTYWAFLNQTIGNAVNPAIMRQADQFSEAIGMIQNWQVVPADGALYPKDEYGEYSIVKEQWGMVADAIKKDFMDNFGNLYKTFLSSPKNVEAFNFVQDYNLGKIAKNAANDKKYQEYWKIVSTMTK
jgi:hypothetical protein